MSASTAPRPSPASSGAAGCTADLQAGLQAVDEALAGAPKANANAFATALTALLRVRAVLSAPALRTTEEGSWRLDRLNAIVSLVLSGQFPLGKAQWEELRLMRGWLVELMERVG